MGELFCFLIGGWILAEIAAFDEIFIGFVAEMFNKTVTVNTYYMCFAIVGILVALFRR